MTHFGEKTYVNITFYKKLQWVPLILDQSNFCSIILSSLLFTVKHFETLEDMLY